MSKVWTDETLALAKKIVHFQDRLIATLSVALHRGIDKQNYGLVVKLLGTIQNDALILHQASQDLTSARPRRGRRSGRNPRWFELAEEVTFFAVETQRAVGQVEREIQRNYWKIVATILTDRLRKCRRLQHDILSIIPRNRLPSEEYTVVKVADELVQTLEKGVSTTLADGSRWRRVHND